MVKRILVVDDDKALVLWLSGILMKRGYAVDVAENGEKAMTKVRSSKPDLIIADIVMPEMDGFELFRKLQRDKNPAHILILTARKLMADTFAAMGQEHFLDKSCKPKELLAKIESLLALPPRSFTPEEMPLVPFDLSTGPGPSLTSRLTKEERGLLGKKMVKYTILGALIATVVFAVVVYSSSRGYVNANKKDALSDRVIVKDIVDNSLNGEVNEQDENGTVRATMFFEKGRMKWKKTYDEKGFLISDVDYP